MSQQSWEVPEDSAYLISRMFDEQEHSIVNQPVGEEEIYGDLTEQEQALFNVMHEDERLHKQMVDAIAGQYDVYGKGFGVFEGEEILDIQEHQHVISDVLDADYEENPVVATNLLYFENPFAATKNSEEPCVGDLVGEIDIGVFNPETETVTYVEVKSANYPECVRYAKKQVDRFASFMQEYDWEVEGEIVVFDEEVTLEDGTRSLPDSGTVNHYHYEPDVEMAEHEGIGDVYWGVVD